VVLALPICFQAASAERDHSAPAPATVAEARQHLRSALESADKKDVAGARASVLAVIENPVFAALDELTRHAALALAAQLAQQSDNFEQAHQFALRATQSTEESADDWRRRLSSAMKIGDMPDEAECLTAIARRWGRDASMLPDATVRQVVRDTTHADAAARLDLLQALFALRWRPAEGSQTAAWWVELCSLLLEQNRTQEAIQVAAIIEDPRDIIAFRADRRYRPLLKSERVRSDPRRAAKDEIEALRKTARERPRSLQAALRLINALLDSKLDAEALTLAEEAARRIDAAGTGPPPYDDDWYFASLLDARGRALRHLGRYDEAVQQLRRGAQLPERRDKVSQPIDLALLLCELDRPDEALLALPSPDQVSNYGNMLIALVRLSAAIELGVGADADKALSYLRAHRKDSTAILQDGLLRAGALEDAEREFLSRLNDPAERTSALVQAQIYAEQKRPARAAEWHDRFIALKERLAVRSAIAQFGEISEYQWTYGYN
jgi:tetratricopeptide (TPR) repeat protein